VYTKEVQCTIIRKVKPYPALGLCQIASGFSVRSRSEPKESTSLVLSSVRSSLVELLSFLSDVSLAFGESDTELSNSFKYLK
jgi:hypothetical protein